MSTPLPSQNRLLHRTRARAALLNLFVGDALAMPVHWYYNPGNILQAFPPHGIRGMEAAPEQHPSSIMRLHSTSSGGRGAQQADAGLEVVGDVILKGKRHLWGRPNGHYHHGLPAGENTLNAWWARRLMTFLATHGDYERRAWAEDYEAFMTASPAEHPDTYAESCHREFFANRARGKDLLDCGGVTHDTPSMGALVTVAPLALALLASQELSQVQHTCREHVALTHPDEGLLNVVDAFVALMARLQDLPVDATPPTNESDGAPCICSNAEQVRDAFAEAAAVIPGTRLFKLLDTKRGDAAIVGGTYSLACYITDSWPSVCYLGAKYFADPGRALLINANLGGENAHRGSVLGVLVGLASGAADTGLTSQLRHADAIAGEVDRWAGRFLAST